MKKMNRRGFLRYLALGGLAAAGTGSGVYYVTAVEPFAVEIVEKDIPIPGLKPGLNGLRAAQISDLHMGLWISREQLEHVAALVLAQKPDLVFITGDSLTDGGDVRRALDDLEAALAGLARSIPVYAVLGNHDHVVGWVGLQEVYDRLGIHLLTDEIQPFQRNGDVLYIAGLDSAFGHYARRRIAMLINRVPTDGPLIGLVHEPDIADYTASFGKIALQVSGHSHGGQVNFPLLGRLVLPEMGQKYPAGLYQVKGMLQYTNRGIGMYHLPARLNCPPEITVFTFIPAAAG